MHEKEEEEDETVDKGLHMFLLSHSGLYRKDERNMFSQCGLQCKLNV